MPMPETDRKAKHSALPKEGQGVGEVENTFAQEVNGTNWHPSELQLGLGAGTVDTYNTARTLSQLWCASASLLPGECCLCVWSSWEGPIRTGAPSHERLPKQRRGEVSNCIKLNTLVFQAGRSTQERVGGACSLLLNRLNLYLCHCWSLPLSCIVSAARH